MTEAVTKLPIKTDTGVGATATWRPLQTLRQEIDRLFEGFDTGSWNSPFKRSLSDRFDFALTNPATDIVEKEKSYEVTAELPGLNEKDVEVVVANGVLTIRGQKSEEKEQKKKGQYLSERRYGSFERYFGLPDGADAENVSASFKNGVLTITLPKTASAQAPEKKIAIKAA